MTARIEIGLDIETTGLEPGDHRIIELFMDLREDGARIDTWHAFIDPKRSIDPKALAVHKITPAMLAGKPDWESLAKRANAFMERADAFVAHNADFDIGFLRYEFARVGLVLPKRPVIDTMAFTWATPDGKSPSLKDLCFACGVDYAETTTTGTGAHAADYDVGVMLECLYRARAWGYADALETITNQRQAA